MNKSTRGVCTLNGKARFTYDEARHKVHKAKMRGEALIEYRCRDAACQGYWHVAHAADDNEGHGGGVQRPKKRIPRATVRRAVQSIKRGGR